ncbi:hypothetical protein SteCoe_13117 [Stentor coeruleus]|uniref:Uncharacterized protein n=1 Tax=Stentor coeruleus TaxID=5963 RepID=A0A1R2C9C1_9CILI|nr:hypothetical protein SteCoe_13117 [Stentor coeruleus]
MATTKEKNRHNSSSLTTCDPSNQSFPLHHPQSPKITIKSPKTISKNSSRSLVPNKNLRSFASVPGLLIPPDLSPKYIEEINRFRQQKIIEYKETLESCLNISVPVIFIKVPYIVCKREKIKSMNLKAEMKRKEIMKKKEQEEIKRLKQSQSLKLNSMYCRMSQMNEKIQKEKTFKNKLERRKSLKDQEKNELLLKSLAIENIKNFYTDRISELKEKIRNEKLQNEIIKYEQKQVVSELEKEKKQRNKVKSQILLI